MNPRVTLGLLAVLLALGGYVYFGGGRAADSGSAGGSGPAGGGGPAGAASKAKPPEPQLDVFQFDDRQVGRLVVRSGGREVAVQKASDDTWVLQPSGEPADRQRISGTLLRLANLRATRRIADPPNLADFGLATPGTTATLSVAGAGDLTLAVGGKAPAEAGTYALKGGDTAVYLVSNPVAQDLERLVNEPPREPAPTPAPSPTP